MKFSIKTFPLFLGFFVLLSGFGLLDLDEKAERILKESKAKLESLQDLQADFSYEIRAANQRMTPVKNEGSIKYKDGMYLIDFDDQKIYCDKRTVWIYLPEENEVMISDYNSDEPMNPDEIFNVYKASATARYDGEENIHGRVCHKIFLAVKDPSLEYNQAYVWINKSNKMLEKVVLIDRKQVKTIFEFNNYLIDKGLGPPDFRFDPSKHADIYIVDERQKG